MTGNTIPSSPWSDAQSVGPTACFSTHHKPAMCEYEGKVFLSWASATTPSNSFYWTTWLESDNGWNGQPNVQVMDDGKIQAHTSALVVFKGVLYAFIPWKATSGSDSGCQIWSYDGRWFNHVGDWSSTWCTPITAVEHKGTLHVVGYNTSDDDHFVWVYSDATTNTITGSSGFSPNARINESSSSNPALVIVNETLHLFFLAAGDGRSVLDTCMNGQMPLSWTRITADTLDESGNSGISAVSNPTSDLLWICFKTHNGENNLICHWSMKTATWTKSIPLGSGGVFPTKNEAALVYSNSWVYAVWNRADGDNHMWWSRRPIKHLNPSIWMSYLVDQSISIAQLSIPGTHDSATSSLHGSSHETGMVRCQDMSITQQLDAGIRYFDIRASYRNIPARNRGQQVTLGAFHGKYYLGLSVQDILGFFYAWLDTHPTEALIVQLKADGADTSSLNVSNDFYALIDSNIEKYWVVAEAIPTLNQIKGKIQLVRRVPLPQACGTSQPFGINAYDNWPNNTAGPVKNDLVSLWVEDNYSWDQSGGVALEKKTQKIKEFIDEASSSTWSPSAPIWYIGYSSYITASAFFSWTKGLADTNFNYATAELDGDTSMNQALEDYVKSKGGYRNPHRVGTLVMDYPNWDSGTLIQNIILTNDLNLNS